MRTHSCVPLRAQAFRREPLAAPQMLVGSSPCTRLVPAPLSPPDPHPRDVAPHLKRPDLDSNQGPTP
jgi:hypothetical protein